MSNQGDIIEYKVPDDNTDPALTTQETYPLLVVSVNDDGTESGVAFLTDGSTRYVHVVPPSEEEKAEASENENLRAENERLRAQAQANQQGQQGQENQQGNQQGDPLNLGSNQ